MGVPRRYVAVDAVVEVTRQQPRRGYDSTSEPLPCADRCRDLRPERFRPQVGLRFPATMGYEMADNVIEVDPHAIARRSALGVCVAVHPDDRSRQGIAPRHTHAHTAGPCVTSSADEPHPGRELREHIHDVLASTSSKTASRTVLVNSVTGRPS